MCFSVSLFIFTSVSAKASSWKAVVLSDGLFYAAPPTPDIW